MDGFQKQTQYSIKTRLASKLSIAILLVALIAGAFAFFSAFKEAHELQDDVLRQIATLLNQQGQTLANGSITGMQTDSDQESRLFVQLLTNGTHNQTLNLPKHLSDGLQTLEVDQTSYRVLVRTLQSGQRLAVAQETAVRDETAQNSALHTVMPFLILIPVLLLLLSDLIQKTFQPISTLSKEIDERSEEELHPIHTQSLPIEIEPLVNAMNRLLIRVEQSIETQKRFMADAAHELRSPLTALSLQAERLADTPLPSIARERLLTLKQGIQRGRNLLEQLLGLARAQASNAQPVVRCSIQAVYRQALENLIPLAEEKCIDIGVKDNLDAELLINEMDLLTIVKNIIENAIRYTPKQGKIDLSVSQNQTHTSLIIEDNGPGIPRAERQRVFDPFYRILGSHEIGSGLGLSIVKTITSKFNAAVSLEFTNINSQRGLRVTITFPN